MKPLLNLWRLARSEGPQRALNTLRHRATERFYERYFQVETQAGMTTEELGFDDPACRMYVPTGYRDLFNLLKPLPVDPERDTFIDFGCGKGRVLLVAATRPFRKVIGVELSPELCTIARENVARAQRRLRCQDVEVVTAPAQEFSIPPETSVVFFWNPFTGAILERVLENLRESHKAHPRPLKVIAVSAPDSEFARDFQRATWIKPTAAGRLREGLTYRIADVTSKMSMLFGVLALA